MQAHIHGVLQADASGGAAGKVALVFVHTLPGWSSLPPTAANMTDFASYAFLRNSVDLCLDMFYWEGDFGARSNLNCSALSKICSAANASALSSHAVIEQSPEG